MTESQKQRIEVLAVFCVTALEIADVYARAGALNGAARNYEIAEKSADEAFRIASA